MRLIRPLTILLCVLLLTAAVPERRTTIFVIGDSTAANKDISGGKQERGWAMALQSYFDDNIFVDNHAVNGRSSKSFIDEGSLVTMMKRLSQTDIQIRALRSIITCRSLSERHGNMEVSLY